MTGLFGRSKFPLEKKIKERKKELRKLVKQKQYDDALKVGNEILEKTLMTRMFCLLWGESIIWKTS